MRSVLVLAALALAGCTTMRGVKTMQLAPSATPQTVTAVAQAKCWDLLGMAMWCRLNMAMETSSGQKVSDFPPDS